MLQFTLMAVKWKLKIFLCNGLKKEIKNEKVGQRLFY